MFSHFERKHGDRQQDKKTKITKDNVFKGMKTDVSTLESKSRVNRLSHRHRWDALLDFKTREHALGDNDEGEAPIGVIASSSYMSMRQRHYSPL